MSEASEELREHQMVIFEILLEVRRVCDQLGLRYFLAGGTLLGAVRHKGFIPWDDDVDLHMPAEDYERFFKEAPAILNQKYFLHEWRLDPSVLNGFARVCLRNSMVSIDSSNKYIQPKFFVDIFPLVPCPDSDEEAERFFKWCTMVYCAMLCRVDDKFVCGYTKKTARFLFQIARRLPRRMLHSMESVVKARVARKSSGARICTVNGRYGYPRESYEAKWYESAVEVEFEGEKFPAPVGWDAELTHVYGDYMTPPPEEERHAKHGFHWTEELRCRE